VPGLGYDVSPGLPRSANLSLRQRPGGRPEQSGGHCSRMGVERRDARCANLYAIGKRELHGCVARAPAEQACTPIFVDDDKPGKSAAARWAAQLQAANIVVDGYSFDGLLQNDGSPVKDLNDLLRVDANQWETHRETIESVMDFTL
jgi:hypothetical protein